MIERAAIQAVTNLEPMEIRFIVHTILSGPPEGALTEGEFLALLVYDLLKEMGFSKEPSASLIKNFKSEFERLGKEYAILESGAPVKAVTLQLVDNRYAFLSDKNGEVYDLKALERVQRIPVPVLSLSIVLPRLFQRSLLAVQGPRVGPGIKAKPSLPGAGAVAVP